MSHGSHVLLAGLDFGSTTSSCMLARARWSKRAATGRVELDKPQVVYRSEPVFTPFADGDGDIDAEHIDTLLCEWTRAASLDLDEVFAGGVIITGLAAQRGNADALARLVGERFGGVVVATAGDPSLESWLAFMGNCAALARTHPDETILNLDIGGGTTNPAAGCAGNVVATGCYGIGARHVEFRPGSFELQRTSALGQHILHCLGIASTPGDELEADAVDRLVAWFVSALEALASGDTALFASDHYSPLVERPLNLDASHAPSALTFSGGVGELVYRASAGEALPGRTAYGDLGVELARGILASELLSKDLGRLRPSSLGRATVYGLSLHSTELSGATLFLPEPAMLPLRDLPIVARLGFETEPQALHDALALVRTHARGTCLQLLGHRHEAPKRATIKAFATRLSSCLDEAGGALAHPLVLLLESDVGKTIGHYLTDWGRRDLSLIVIDEIPDRHAHFVNVGELRDGVVPVACYGVG